MDENMYTQYYYFHIIAMVHIVIVHHHLSPKHNVLMEFQMRDQVNVVNVHEILLFKLLKTVMVCDRLCSSTVVKWIRTDNSSMSYLEQS
jgi:hypothetical protein